MSFETSINSSKYSVPKLASDGSNWVTYRERMKVVQAAKGHMPHIRGTTRKPPLPPPIDREHPHIPRTNLSSTGAGVAETQTPLPQQGELDENAPIADAYSHLTDDEYIELVEKLDPKYTTWEAKEAGARALIYETLSDDLFIEVQSQPTAKALWEAVVGSCENKSLMYANAIRTRIQNTRCPEGGDVRAHLALLQRERQNLAAVGSRLGDPEFAAVITNSMPESYYGRVQSILDISSLAGHVIPIEFLIGKLNEEYDRRAILKANETALAASTGPAAATAAAANAPFAGRQSIECYNCHRRGHIARNCRQKGGGKEGQWPKPGAPRDDEGPGAANAAAEKHHGFFALGNTVTCARALATRADSYVDVFDSGASVHISPYRERFTSYQELSPPRMIAAANGEEFAAVGCGDVPIRVPNGPNSTRDLTLKGVLYAPGVAFALVSIRKADEGGYTAVFEQGECRLVERASGTSIARIPLVHGLYQVTHAATRPFSEPIPATAAATTSTSRPGGKRVLEVTPNDLHRHLGHVSIRAAKALVNDGRVTGVKLLKSDREESCETCVRAKLTRKAIPDIAHPAPHDIPITRYGEKFHSDTWDADATSLGGNTKSALFVDEHTRMHHGYPIKSVAETSEAYKELEAAVLTQTGVQVKWLHSDNGGEYIALKAHLASRGTHWSASTPHTPEQNGVAERAHRTHRERVSAMLLDANLPKTLWPHAYKHSIYLHNRSGHSKLAGKTPYEARFGTPPDLRHLRPWGSPVWVKPEQTRKLDPRGVGGRFVGFSEHHKDAINVYWPERRNVTVVRSFVWANEPETDTSEGARIEGVANASEESEGSEGSEDEGNDARAVAEAEGPGVGDGEGGEDLQGAEPREGEGGGDLQGADPQREHVVEEEPPREILGRGRRIKKPSVYVRRLQQGEGTLLAREVMGAMAAHEPITDEPLSDPFLAASGNDWSAVAQGLVAQAGGDPMSGDPRSLREAQEAPDWPQWAIAIDVEKDNLIDHGMYILVERPSGVHVIGCQLIFHRKRDAEGLVIQHKVRAVALGCAQIPGVDFNETFAPVAKSSSLRLMLALAARYNWPLIQLDVKSAYLNGDLDEVIYMRQPPGTAKPGQEHLVCKLQKSLYGLKQAGRAWYKTYRQAMEGLGMSRSQSDHACFSRHEGDSLVMVSTIVDDMLVTGSSELVERFRTGIKNRFTVTDAGEVAWLLGIEVARDRKQGTLRLAQRSAIDTLARALHLEGAKNASTPIAVGGVLSKAQCPTTNEAIADMSDVPYREGVGMCMYIAVTTRPDVAYSVHRLAQYMSNPGRPHWEALKRLVRYLVGTRELWLSYGHSADGLAGFTDADWGTSDDARHSVCGYVYSFDGGAVSWSAKKQAVVALSSTEAEYIGITHAAKEAIWLRALLSDLVDPDVAKHPVQLHSDNKSAMDLAKNNVFHARTKHIGIRYHFIREAVERGEVELVYRRTEDMPADVFTKPLTRTRLDHLRMMFGLRAL